MRVSRPCAWAWMDGIPALLANSTAPPLKAWITSGPAETFGQSGTVKGSLSIWPLLVRATFISVAEIFSEVPGGTLVGSGLLKSADPPEVAQADEAQAATSTTNDAAPTLRVRRILRVDGRASMSFLICRSSRIMLRPTIFGRLKI